MRLYSSLSKISFLKNRYVSKFLFVAFLAIHIPLMGLVFFILYLEHRFSAPVIVLVTLLFSFIATGITLIILKKLMLPYIKGAEALANYRTNLIVPRLPINYTDEAGVMLKNIQATIQSNQKLLTEKKVFFKFLTDDLKNQTLTTELLLKNIYKEAVTTEVKNSVSAAEKSVLQQLDFVDTYIALLKEEELIAKERLKLQKVNIHAFVDEVKLKFKSNLEAKNLSVSTEITVSDVKLKVNRKLLQQALSYLMENAIKYAPNNTKVGVKIERRRGSLMLYFRNDGLGFEVEQAEKIFTNFCVTTGNNASYSAGTALYLTRQIVEHFGGNILAESEGKSRGVAISVELKMYR
jgi:signal transduction histidine kinase